jgi:hypothetical protein
MELLEQHEQRTLRKSWTERVTLPHALACKARPQPSGSALF